MPYVFFLKFFFGSAFSNFSIFCVLTFSVSPIHLWFVRFNSVKSESSESFVLLIRCFSVCYSLYELSRDEKNRNRLSNCFEHFSRTFTRTGASAYVRNRKGSKSVLDGGDTMHVSLKWRRRGKRGAKISRIFLWAVSFICCLSSTPFALAKRPQPIYQNQFAVHIPSSQHDADHIADKHGFVNLGQVIAMIMKSD